MTEENTQLKKPMLVLGAGQLGLAVLRELAPRLDPAKQSLSVLLAPGMMESRNVADQKTVQEVRELGADIVEIDLKTVSVGDLTDLFKPFHTVVSCTGFVGGKGTQLKMTNAALDAGVKRYFPWQFGVDYDIVGRGSPQDVFDEQYDVRLLLRAQNKTEWVIVSTGMFTSFLFEPSFDVVNLEKKTINALGSWDTKVTVTTPEDIGKLTTDIILAQPHFANEVVFVAGDTLSYGRLAEIVETVSGEQFRKTELTREMLGAFLTENPDDVMGKYRAAFAQGDGMHWDKATTYNVANNIPTVDVKGWLEAHLDETR
ncbi:aromatic alcohol reductase [Thalassospira lucentensis]|uniref:aromatic alcohol reductase n=1 Tax=Thalassospira lucentensis TaxID=168935 RepID=UPI003AA7BA62